MLSHELQLAFALFCVLMATVVGSQSTVAVEPVVISLWEGVAPGSEEFTGKEQTEQRGNDKVSDSWLTGTSQPTLTVVAPPEAERNGTAVVICPGGGYGGLAWDKEGLEIGQWFADMGVTSFVLKYRHGGGVHQHPVPLSDVQRAMRIVRSQAEEWKVRPRTHGRDRLLRGWASGFVGGHAF